MDSRPYLDWIAAETVAAPERSLRRLRWPALPSVLVAGARRRAARCRSCCRPSRRSASRRARSTTGRSRRGSRSPTATTCIATSSSSRVDAGRRRARRAGTAAGQDQGRRVLRQGRNLSRDRRREVAAGRRRGRADGGRSTAESQGCADVGVCYPPTRQKVTLALPAPGSRSRRAGRGDAAQEELVQLAPSDAPARSAQLAGVSAHYQA